jgi:hypothetical protein
MQEKTVNLHREVVNGETRRIMYYLKGNPLPSYLILNKRRGVIFRAGQDSNGKKVRKILIRKNQLGKMERDALELPEEEFREQYPNIELDNTEIETRGMRRDYGFPPIYFE